MEDLPPRRLPHQRFVFLVYETISNTNTPCQGKCLPAHIYKMKHFFNWTMSHRRDSDIYVAQPYGAVAFRKDFVPLQLPAHLEPGTLPKQTALLFAKAPYKQLQNRTKMVVWFNSNCVTRQSGSWREDYVAELSKHVPVDIYGKCGPLKCLTRNDVRCEPLLADYKFHLSMENSLCPDYVSEKFYRALDNNIVPVVYGGADYNEYGPPHSYINVADFDSPKDLADYLSLLDKHPALYMAYFNWKKTYEVVYDGY